MLVQFIINAARHTITQSTHGFAAMESPDDLLKAHTVRTIRAIRRSPVVKKDSITIAKNRAPALVAQEYPLISTLLQSRHCFYRERHWLTYWAIALAMQQLVASVTAVNASETAHNGAVLGHITGDAWWFSMASAYQETSASEQPRITALSLERERDVYGADFAILTPAGPSVLGPLIKVMLIQAKRRTKGEDTIDTKQKFGKVGHSQLDELVQVDDTLLYLAGRAAATEDRLLFDSACYYVGWDRLEQGTPACVPTLKSARSVKIEKTKRNARRVGRGVGITKKKDNSTKMFENSCDFSALVALHFMHIPSKVGVIVPISDIDKYFPKLSPLPLSTIFIGNQDPNDVIQNAALDALRQLGYVVASQNIGSSSRSR